MLCHATAYHACVCSGTRSGGNAIAWGLEKDPSGDAHALQACGADAASHLEAQCTRRCIIAIIA
eukprot:4099498-Pyramimonas_sp.AAC.1